MWELNEVNLDIRFPAAVKAHASVTVDLSDANTETIKLMLEQEERSAASDPITIRRTDDASTWQTGDDVDILIEFPTQEGGIRHDWVFRRTSIIRADPDRVLVLDESGNTPTSTWHKRACVQLRAGLHPAYETPRGSARGRGGRV